MAGAGHEKSIYFSLKQTMRRRLGGLYRGANDSHYKCVYISILYILLFEQCRAIVHLHLNVRWFS